MNEREELNTLRRVAALEARAGLDTQRDLPAINIGALVDTAKDLPEHIGRAGAGFAHGVGDLVVGAGQLASKFMPQEIGYRFTDYMKQREQEYQDGRGNYADRADIGRITGNIVPSLLLGGAPAATLPARMMQGAKVGGTIGLVSPVNPESSDFGIQKAFQVGGGAALGGFSVPVVETLARGAGAAVNAASRSIKGLFNTATGAASQNSIETTLKIELQRSGIDWGLLSQEARKSLVSEVQKSLKAGGVIDREAISRLADFKQLGIEPTVGQVTRNPLQFSREQNLARTETGLPIAERLGSQNLQLLGAIDDIRGQSGAVSPDPYAAGQAVSKGLVARDAPAKIAVADAYTSARSLAGVEAEVPLQPVAQRVGSIIEDFGDDKIPGAVMSRLREFGVMDGKQTRVFNIREAEKLKTLIGNNIDNPTSPSGKALTLLKNSINDAVNSLAEGGTGAEAAGAFQLARGQAAARFGKIDRTPALENALGRDPVAPEKFIEKFAIRAEVKDVANFMRNLPVEARPEVRAGVMDWIKQQSISGYGEAAKFSYAGFNKAMKAIGDRKLNLIFAGDKSGLTQLEALRRVSGYIQNPPVASGVNYSASGTAILDALDSASRLPLLGAILGKPTDIVRATQAARAIGPVAPVRNYPGLLTPDLLDRTVPGLGLLGGAGAASLPATMFK